jgi:hypothetical protein
MLYNRTISRYEEGLDLPKGSDLMFGIPVGIPQNFQDNGAIRKEESVVKPDHGTAVTPE